MAEIAKIDSKEFEHIVGEGANDLWGTIESTVEYTNLSKGYQDIVLILQRNSDNKFFKFSYCSTDWMVPFLKSNPAILKGEEVFPKQKTITYYE